MVSTPLLGKASRIRKCMRYKRLAMSDTIPDERTRRVRRVALLYLVASLCFVWGYAVARYQVFPWVLLAGVEADIDAFVRGDVNDETTVGERLLNDLNIAPKRQIRDFAPRDGLHRELVVAGLRSRREPPRLHITDDAPRLHRIIAGALDFDDALWGALLFDPDGKVLHSWQMSGEIAELTDEPDVLKNLYGLGFLDDGSAVFSMQERAGGLIKIDVCSRLEWSKPGEYHHVATPTEDQSGVWTFSGGQGDLHPTLVLVDAATGSTLREIDMADVERANPHTLIFDLQRGGAAQHATHPNDIEPLPATLADAYEMFDAGDLLLSYHTTNLVFVVDPDTLKIKWWYVGAGDGQHDPDWQADGTISLFNNNYRAGRRGSEPASTIVTIDPAANSHSVLVDGRNHDFYSNFNGHHRISSAATVMITSSTQGRYFEVEPASGEVVFEYLNSWDWEAGQMLHLSEAFEVTAELAARWAATDCNTG